MFLRTIMMMSLSLNFWGCGDEDQDKGLASLAGSSWIGQFKAATDEGVKATIPVSFQFKEDNSFRTLSLADVSKSAKGEYQDMPRHGAILLTVQESNFDSFSLADTSKTFDYSLDGDELVLKSYEGIYTLVRDQGDGTDPTNPFIGSWQCTDSSKGEWGLDFDESSFFGRRTQEGTRALNLWGIVTYAKSGKDQELPDLAEITLERSNQGEVRGMRMRAEIDHGTARDVKIFKMFELQPDGTKKANGLETKCRRG